MSINYTKLDQCHIHSNLSHDKTGSSVEFRRTWRDAIEKYDGEITCKSGTLVKISSIED